MTTSSTDATSSFSLQSGSSTDFTGFSTDVSNITDAIIFNNDTYDDDENKTVKHGLAITYATLVEEMPLRGMLDFTLNMILQLIIFFIIAGISWKCLVVRMHRTALHAFIAVISYNFLIYQCVMTGFPYHVYLVEHDLDERFVIHVVSAVSGSGLGVLGILVKVFLKYEHFNTRHGRCGLGASVLCVLNCLTGLAAIYPDSVDFLFSVYLIRIIHTYISTLIVVSIIITNLYAYRSGFFRRNFQNVHVYKLFIITSGLMLIMWNLVNVVAGYKEWMDHHDDEHDDHEEEQEEQEE